MSTTNETVMEKGKRKFTGIGTMLRDTVTVVRGLGDVIRGNINAAADGVGEGLSGKKQPQPDPYHDHPKSDKVRGSEAWQEVANKGLNDVRESIDSLRRSSSGWRRNSRKYSREPAIPETRSSGEFNKRSLPPPLPALSADETSKGKGPETEQAEGSGVGEDDAREMTIDEAVRNVGR